MKKVLLFTLVLCSSYCLRAQDEQKGFRKDKLFAGGNFGLTFGDYALLNLSPQLGYRFNQYLAAGVGINAQYVSVKQRYNGNLVSKTSQGVAGLNIFGRVYPFKQFMIQLQPEENYVFGNQTFYQPTRQDYKLDAQIVPSLLAGGGFVFPSGRGAFIAAVFYDVLQNPDSPYGKRLIWNFGFNIGL